MEGPSSGRCHSSEEKRFHPGERTSPASPPLCFPSGPGTRLRPGLGVTARSVSDRLTYCCCPARNLTASATWKQPNWMGKWAQAGLCWSSFEGTVTAWKAVPSGQEALRAGLASTTRSLSSSGPHWPVSVKWCFRTCLPTPHSEEAKGSRADGRPSPL